MPEIVSTKESLWAFFWCAFALSTSLFWISTASGQGDLSQEQDSVGSAYQFLINQMDQYHRALVVAAEAEYGAYYPSGLMGDVESLAIGFDVSGDEMHSGRSCLRIDLDPEKPQRLGWSGVAFQYPDGNWGAAPGRDLTGAGRISIWAKASRPVAVQWLSGGTNPVPTESRPHSDSFEQFSVGWTPLDTTWREIAIDLTGKNLACVISPVSLVLKAEKKPVTIFLDDMEIDLPGLSQPRFIQSYASTSCLLGAPGNAAHVYDQSLALLAFLARGGKDYLDRARLLADALVIAQNKDRTFKDGRLRNAYASGELIDPYCDCTRFPGRWSAERKKLLEDEFSLGTDTGNMAWAALALVQAHETLSPERTPYLESAIELADWLIRHTEMTDELGGFCGGYEGAERSRGDPAGQPLLTWRSTEHNIDLVALFTHLERVAGRDSAKGRYWREKRSHALKFLDAMWCDANDGAFLKTGTRPDSKEPNAEAVPLDAQTWAILGLLASGETDRYSRALEWALQHCRGGVKNTFDFNCNDGDGAWWEGTAQVAAALRFLKRNDEAKPIIETLKTAQIRRGPFKGAVPAASECGLTTGFHKTWPSTQERLPWLYPDAPHIGATAWYLFSLLGKNPYFLAEGPLH